jgi:hypothetical protein
MYRFPRRLAGALAVATAVSAVAAVSHMTAASAAAPRAQAAPVTEISCIMSFAESSYHYGATPSQTLTTFAWGSNGTLPVDCRGTVNGLTIDPTRQSQFSEHGTETATCTQGAGFAIATLTVPTVGGGTRTTTMPLQNTFTGTTFDITGTDNNIGLGAVGSWALPPSSAPCPATNPGPISSIQVAHAFQIYSL